MKIERIPGDVTIHSDTENLMIDTINELVNTVNGLVELVNKQNRVLLQTADEASCLANGIQPD